jgi:hypothetical protein
VLTGPELNTLRNNFNNALPTQPQANWTVEQTFWNNGVVPNDDAAANAALARGLTTEVPVSSTTEMAIAINYSDSNQHNFSNPVNNFPGGGGNHFTVRGTGFVVIPTAGPWTFATDTDDTAYLDITTNVDGVFHLERNCCGTQFATFNFTEAGTFPIEMIFGESGGGEDVELYAQFGSHGSFNNGFRLVGDTFNGGLEILNELPIPEPSTLAYAAVGLVSLGSFGWRRRRR